MKKHLLAVTFVLGCKGEAPRPADPAAPDPAKSTAATRVPATPSNAPSGARDYITIVGSSTVYPFSTVVAEQFGKSTGQKTPKVESTGSGGGLKLFCEGVGVKHPDIANSSRRIKTSEVSQCAKNGVTDIIELKVGYDGIVVASSKQAEPLAMTLRTIWLALAKQIPDGASREVKPNAYQKWSDIDPKLPSRQIEVLGPPPTSGTRDAFVELAMEAGCSTFDWLAALKSSDEPRFKALCHTLREDGRFIEAGENDNLIVQKLEANPGAFGVFGFSFLDQNSEKVQASTIEGVSPTFEAIASGSYPISRPLYVYVKKAHVHMIPGIAEYLAELTSPKAWSPDGYLADKGMIPMPEAERARFRDVAVNLTLLQM
jgi:phosphate transport system substrate-binding protein